MEAAAGTGLDPRTFAIAAGVAAAIQAGAILYVWRVLRRDHALLPLAGATALAAIGAMIGLSRPHLHPLLTHFLANITIISGHALGAFACGRFLGRRVPPSLLIGIVVLAGLVTLFFLVVAPRIDIRLATYSLAVGFYSLIISMMLLDVPRGPLRVTHWPVGILYLMHGVFALLRAFSVLVEPPRSDVFEPSVIQTLWFAQSLAIVNLTFIGVVLMVTQRLRLEIDRYAREDGLTGALNRQAFDQAAEAEWSRSTRHDLPLSVLVIDLDHFKALNDTHGHEAGDAWLKVFAELTGNLLRHEDLLCRYGGEEFVVLLPQTRLDAALQAAERIRRMIEGHRLAHGTAAVAVTVSIGVAARGGEYKTLKSMIAAADRALYRAKAAGRNRTMTAV